MGSPIHVRVALPAGMTFADREISEHQLTARSITRQLEHHAPSTVRRRRYVLTQL
jgi:D-tyrosyl-tRNA(Tyr) deacylase